jgi:hypothetical protein
MLPAAPWLKGRSAPTSCAIPSGPPHGCAPEWRASSADDASAVSLRPKAIGNAP